MTNNSKVLISVVIATFNSERTLEMVLKSIKEQTIISQVEILSIDGGSTDKTLQIAEQYNCRVINNSQTEPVNAKLIGYKEAKGKYIVYLDHDEVITTKDSFERKLSIFIHYKGVRAVVGSGYRTPPHTSFINNYINEFGDPFSFFIYRLSKDYRFFFNIMKVRYNTFIDGKDFSIFKFQDVKNLPIIELCALGSMIDAEYLKKNFPQTLKLKELIPHFFYLLNSKGALLGFTQDDYLLHFSSDNLKNYFNKIKWRIKNNIYHKDTMGESGFSGRIKYNSNFMKIKGYLFIFYSFSLILPLIDGVSLCLTRKEISYIIHPILCIYTAILIVYHYFLYSVGKKQKLKSYDGSIEVK